jgi:hypothetical protein
MVTEATMAFNRLYPKEGGRYLSPTEVIERLKQEFAQVEVDVAKGEVHVLRMIEQLARMQDFTPPPASPEDIERLRSVKNEARFVTVMSKSKDEDAYLSTCIISGEALFFDYSSARHEMMARPLLERFAAALNYEIC